MTQQDPGRRRQVAPPRGGAMRVLQAARYSLAGFRRLWAEAAARQELLAAVLTAFAFVVRGAEFWHWLIAGALLSLLLAVEALNTAIEVLADRISPEWSVTARDAKDLGSFAVGIVLLMAGGFVLSVLVGAV